MKFFSKLFLLILLSLNVHSQNIITNSGLNFVPDTLNIYTGDTINFVLGNSHNAVEVDSLTYSINGSNPLVGGFNIDFGADTTIILNTIKTYYYVCQPHVNFGMKGVIIVSNPTILGCTDPNACNYDSLANLDDGSCDYDDTTFVSINSCNSFLWDGITYDSSGIYSNQYTNFNGCGSTVILDLTVNYTTSSYSSTTSCDSYFWNGITYFNSGNYFTVLTGSNGCDSIANLDLIIYNSPVLNITSNNVSCYNGNDGSIDLTSSANPSNYLWSTGDTTEDI